MPEDVKTDSCDMAAELKKIQECGDNVAAYVKGVVAGAQIARQSA